MRNGWKLCIIDNEIYINLQNVKKNKASVYNSLQLSTKKKTEKCRKTDLSTELSTISTVEKRKKKLEKTRQYKTSVLCDFLK